MTTPVAHGWDARMCISGGGAPATGNRLVVFGQTAIFAEGFVAYGGENEDQAVDVAKWLSGGGTTGTIWVSSHLDDYSLYVTGGTSIVAVGSTVRSALTTAGFTISESTDTNDTITYPAFDLAIVGDEDSFGQLLSTTDDRCQQLIDFVNDGGGLMIVKTTQPNFFDLLSVEFGVWFSGGWYENVEEVATLVGATAMHPVLFPSGRTVYRRRNHWVTLGLFGIDVDANHGLYAVDGTIKPWQYATYSAHGDA